MSPPASILFPTRRRRDYLAVALARSPAGRRARRRDRRRRGRRRGRADPRAGRIPRRRLRRARRPAGHQRRAQRLRRALHRRADLLPRRRRRGVARGWALPRCSPRPAHEALGGPIRPRIEGTDLHACGREPLPVTALDLGPEDREAEFVWGANLALRRERVRADRAVRRARSAARATRRTGSGGCAPRAGRVGYVAAAGVDHRRAGRDATLRGAVAGGLLPRAARRAATTPSRARRRRSRPSCARSRAACGTSCAAAAGSGSCSPRSRSGGSRRRSTPRRRRPAPPTPTTCPAARARSAAAPRWSARSRTARAALRRLPAARAVARRARGRRGAACTSSASPAPENLRTVARLRRELARSRHDVALHLAPPAAGRGQVGERQRRARRRAARRRRLAADRRRRRRSSRAASSTASSPLAEALRLRARPARARVRLARRVGRHAPPPGRARPPHAVRRDRPGDRAPARRAARELLPVPGPADGLGPRRPLERASPPSAAGRSASIDATPVRHLRPVAAAYPRDAAIAEAEAFLDGRAYVTRDAGRRDARGVPRAVALMRVVVVAEYYPRAADPALGVWAHRQALAARDAGADVEVARAAPARAVEGGAAQSRDPAQLVAPLRQPLRNELDGIARDLRAVRRAAAAALVRVLGRVGRAVARARAAALNAVRPRPRALRGARGRRRAARGSACRPWSQRPRRRRARRGRRSGANGRAVVERSLRRREAGARQLGGDRRALPARSARSDVRVVHLGTDVPAAARHRAATDFVTVGNLIARKRHADVLRALGCSAPAPATLASIGDGPERARAGAPRRELGMDAREFRGALATRAGARGSPQRPACSCCPASRRRSASPTSRRWPRACPRSARAASTARRRSRAAAAG